MKFLKVWEVFARTLAIMVIFLLVINLWASIIYQFILPSLVQVHEMWVMSGVVKAVRLLA